jgi:hypothetical protein
VIPQIASGENTLRLAPALSIHPYLAFARSDGAALQI